MVRKNIRYRAIQIEARLRTDQQDKLVAQLVRKETGKVIIYYNSRRRVDRLVALGLFEYDRFYREIIDEKKLEVLEVFQIEKIRVIVAISALGIGIDIIDIRLIIYADELRDLLDYAQESRRVGRDRKASKVVVLVGVDGSKDSLVREYLDGIRYRRRIIDEFLDRVKERVRCGNGEESYNGYREEVIVEDKKREGGLEIEEDRREKEEVKTREEEVKAREEIVRQIFKR